jgi:ferredoxin
MNTSIYYFSGTGNSLAVAKDIARELNSPSNIVELIPIAGLSGQKTIKITADTIGIIFPVYYHDMPPIIEEFISKLDLSDSYIFSVATYNQDAGNALSNLNSILGRKGSRLASGFTIQMPSNFALFVDLTTTDEENEKRFIEEKRKIKEIAEVIKDRKASGIEDCYNPDEKYELKSYFYSVYKMPDQFLVTEKCNQCGICEQVCPKNNIQMVDGKIIWGQNCEHCLACLHWCPEEAIQNGSDSHKCRRYHHPDISVKEMIMGK